MSNKKAAMPVDAVFTESTDIQCNSCTHVATAIYTAAKGPHTAAYCIACHSFLKFLPKVAPKSGKGIYEIFWIVTATKRTGKGMVTVPIGIEPEPNLPDDPPFESWSIFKDPSVTLGRDRISIEVKP